MTWDLFWMLTRTEFRLRDQGTWAGFLWTLLHPLFLFSVLYGVFTHSMSAHVPDYAAYLLIGIVQWNFFATGTTAGLTSLRRKAGLLSSFSFPRVHVVLSSIAAVLLSHLLEWAVLLAALVAMGTRPSPGWLALPAIIALEVALVTAVSCVLSTAAVRIRDLDRVWSLLLFGLFFLTPVFYVPEVVGAQARQLVAFNPIALILEISRAAMLGGAYGGPASALLAAGTLGLCAASLLLFQRASRGIAEHL